VSPLNRLAANVPIGVTVDMIGYGQTSPSDSASAGIQHALLDRVSESCASFGSSNNTLLCFSAADGKSKCTGDSGSASFATIDGVATVVGVTSFTGMDMGTICKKFNADTRVDAEIDFVDMHVGPKLRCEDDGVCGEGCGMGDLPVDPNCEVPDNDDGGCRAAGGDPHGVLIALLVAGFLIQKRRQF
jgi:hypothetical protein